MTLDQLRYFVAAARYENISKAARSIPISTSVVSQAVSLLEEELTCHLFRREKQRISLTGEGHQLLQLADGLLKQAENIRTTINMTNAPLEGHYRIGASHFLAVKLLAPIWAEIQEKHPGITGDIHSMQTEAVIGNILSGNLDFGICFSPAPHPQLAIEEIHQGNMRVAVRKNHPLINKSPSEAYEKLSDFPSVMHIATEHILALRPHPMLRSLNVKTESIMGFDNDFVAFEKIKRSDAWTMIPDIIIENSEDQVQSLKKTRNWSAPFFIAIVRHKSRPIDPGMDEITKRVSQQIIQMKKPK